MACGSVVPPPGVEPVPHSLEVQSLNHWTAREDAQWSPSALSFLAKPHMDLSSLNQGLNRESSEY